MSATVANDGRCENSLAFCWLRRSGAFSGRRTIYIHGCIRPDYQRNTYLGCPRRIPKTALARTRGKNHSVRRSSLA